MPHLPSLLEAAVPSGGLRIKKESYPLMTQSTNWSATLQLHASKREKGRVGRLAHLLGGVATQYSSTAAQSCDGGEGATIWRLLWLGGKLCETNGTPFPRNVDRVRLHCVCLWDWAPVNLPTDCSGPANPHKSRRKHHRTAAAAVWVKQLSSRKMEHNQLRHTELGQGLIRPQVLPSKEERGIPEIGSRISACQIMCSITE